MSVSGPVWASPGAGPETGPEADPEASTGDPDPSISDLR